VRGGLQVNIIQSRVSRIRPNPQDASQLLGFGVPLRILEAVPAVDAEQQNTQIPEYNTAVQLAPAVGRDARELGRGAQQGRVCPAVLDDLVDERGELVGQAEVAAQRGEARAPQRDTQEPEEGQTDGYYQVGFGEVGRERVTHCGELLEPAVHHNSSNNVLKGGVLMF